MALLLRLTAIERPARSGWLRSKPLSMTATPTPEPVWPDQALEAPVSIGYVVSRLPAPTCEEVAAIGAGEGGDDDPPPPRRPPSRFSSRFVTSGKRPGLNETAASGET